MIPVRYLKGDSMLKEPGEESVTGDVDLRGEVKSFSLRLEEE